MSKIDTVRAAMMQAMKDKDKPRKNALSLLLSALKSKAIDKRADMTEEEENAVIFREIKQAQEKVDTTPADRTEIIGEARLRMQVSSEFVPKLMDEGELLNIDAFNQPGVETSKRATYAILGNTDAKYDAARKEMTGRPAFKAEYIL